MNNPIQGKKIFILDDDHDFIALVTKILENVGAQVYFATDVEQAQKVFTQTRPHLALIDMNLSHRSNGKEFIKYIHQLPQAQQVPIAVVSAHSDSRTLAEFEKDEIEVFIIKPIRSDIFIRKIKNVFKKNKNQVLEYIFDSSQELILNLEAELTEISELGCRIEASASVAKNESILIKSPFLEKIGVDACRFVASGLNTISKDRTYKNDIDFIGLDEKTLTMLRKVKQFK